MPKSIKSLFPKLEVFNFLQESDYDVIESYMFRYDYEAGKYVFKEGAHGGYMFFVVDGEAEVSKLVKGKKVSIAKIGAGRSLGEMSLLDGYTRSASVQAATTLSLLVLKREDLNRLMDEHPVTANRMILGIATLLSQSVRETTQEFTEQTLTLC